MVVYYHDIFVPSDWRYCESYHLVAEDFSIYMDDLGLEVVSLYWFRFSHYLIKFTYWCTLEMFIGCYFYGYLVFLGGCNGVFDVFGYQLYC